MYRTKIAATVTLAALSILIALFLSFANLTPATPVTNESYGVNKPLFWHHNAGVTPFSHTDTIVDLFN